MCEELYLIQIRLGMKRLATLLEGAGYLISKILSVNQTLILLWCSKAVKLEKELT